MGDVGQLLFKFYDESNILHTMYCDTIQSMSDNITASTSVTPIVTYTAEDAFAFDISANEEIQIPFIRKNPHGVTYTQSDETGNSNITQAMIDSDPAAPSKGWSNRKWQERFTEYINRWQARSNGCKMTYIPPGSAIDPDTGKWADTEYQHAINDLNVFIRSISFDNNTSSYETVSGTIALQVGSMTADALTADSTSTHIQGYNDQIDFNDMTVIMTTPDGLAEYTIYRKIPGFDINCITEYTLKGGSEQPFEYLTMRLSKKRLSAVAPELMDNIFAGRNRIKVNAIGIGEFIVTKCSTTGQYYKIVAYSKYELYRSYAYEDSIPFGATGSTPLNIIKSTLVNALGPAEDPLQFPEQKIVYAIRSENNVWSNTGQYYFSGGTSAWYIMSVCALMLSAKIWFSDDTAYIIDTSLTVADISKSSTTKSGHFTNTSGYTQISLLEIPNLYLNLNSPFPLNITDAERAFSTAVCDAISLGDEGAETIHNNVIVKFGNDTRNSGERERNNLKEGVTWTGLTRARADENLETYWYITDLTDMDVIEQSQEKYGKKDVTYLIPEINDVDATKIANRTAAANCDSEQSVGFKLVESHIEQSGNTFSKYWQKYFPPLIRVDTIYDYSNDLMDSNYCNYAYSPTDHMKLSYWSTNDPDHVSTRDTTSSTPMVVEQSYVNLSILAQQMSGICLETYQGTTRPVFYDINTDQPVDDVTYKIISTHTVGDYTLCGIEFTAKRSVYVKIASVGKSLGYTTYFNNGILTFYIDRHIRMPNKLWLSTYEHKFPDGITEYWFGIMKPTDITQNSSEISNALYNQ